MAWTGDLQQTGPRVDYILRMNGFSPMSVCVANNYDVIIRLHTVAPNGHVQAIPGFAADRRLIDGRKGREVAEYLKEVCDRHVQLFLEMWVDPRSPSAPFLRACKRAMKVAG